MIHSNIYTNMLWKLPLSAQMANKVVSSISIEIEMNHVRSLQEK